MSLGHGGGQTSELSLRHQIVDEAGGRLIDLPLDCKVEGIDWGSHRRARGDGDRKPMRLALMVASKLEARE